LVLQIFIMKKITVSLIALFMFFLSEAQTATYSPCTDSLYVALKKKSLSEMNEREFNYFSQKDKECSTFMQLKQQEQKSNEMIRQQQAETDKMIKDSKKSASKGIARWFLGWGVILGVIYFVTKLL